MSPNQDFKQLGFFQDVHYEKLNFQHYFDLVTTKEPKCFIK
jgi:hypothetical protein